jgi:two-component system, NtrC family, sensor histidine kinase HydH
MLALFGRKAQIGLVAFLFTGLGLAHFLVNPHAHQVHDFLFKATYVQIILGALWFGLWGGLLTSGATSVLYLFHILLQLRGHGPHTTASLLLELLLYNLVAVVTGILSARQAQARSALERTSRDLEESYRSLQKKTMELITLEEQLRSAGRLGAIGELAAGMAHELRNPLGGIQGAAEILSRTGTSAESRAEFAQVLLRETARLERVITDFLNYARPKAPGSGPVSVDESVATVLRLLEAPLRKQKIVVQGAQGPLGAVRLEEGQLKQVLLNLILNAVQAMPEGGVLTLRSRRAEDLLVVSIQDTGRGIPEEIRKSFLEPFVTARPGGTGLGLSICVRILEGAGGRLELAATGDTGTTFELFLPAAGRPGTEPAGEGQG